MTLARCAGPSPAFFTGNIAEISALGGAALAHAKFSQRYGPVYSTFGAPQPWVVTDSPVLAQDVLQQHSVRPTMPSLLSGKDLDFDRANILAAVGNKHRSLRGAWLPLFYTGRHAYHSPVTVPCLSSVAHQPCELSALVAC